MQKIFIIFLILNFFTTHAQNNTITKNLQDTTPSVTAQQIEITATRLRLTPEKAPFAISVLTKSQLQNTGTQLSIYESLNTVAGVVAMNPDNYAQDLRISIRGFGARAAFGIRGIRIITDGLPEGTPDGQTDVDNLDIGIVQQLEVLRGAAAGLYGNASGGVIYLSTETPLSKRPILEAQTAIGQFGFQRYQIKFGENRGKIIYFANASFNKTEGYRYLSAMENHLLNGKIIFQPHTKHKFTLLANVGASPYAFDAGGLTQTQIQDNPQQANNNNIAYETTERVAQNRIGLIYDFEITDNQQLQIRTFNTTRHLENRLPVLANGFGDLKRIYNGLYINYQTRKYLPQLNTFYRFKVGLDIDNQLDTRNRFSYKTIQEAGKNRFIADKNVLQQLEKFQSIGIFALQDWQIGRTLFLSFGLRYDKLFLSVDDQFLNDGNQSGKRHFDKWNPMFGVNYLLMPQISIYSNISSTFESPTLNELSNNPTGIGGFNPDLQPQTAQSVELGAKGTIFWNNQTQKITYDMAIYHITTQNDAVPYQISGQAGKTFFRNAGKTNRKGIELSLNMLIHQDFTIQASGMLTNYKYVDYTVNNISYKENQLPNSPRINTQFALKYAPTYLKGFATQLQFFYRDKMFANDANTSFAAAYRLWNLRLSHIFSFRHLEIAPFLSINNLTNTQYIGNILINATNDRFFEPAMPRYFFGGIKFNYKINDLQP